MGLPSSSRLAPPAMAITASRSQTAAMPSVDLRMLSQICAAKSDSSPTGEYFLKISSPSRSVKISSGSPSQITLARKTLSGRFSVSWTIVTFKLSFVPELKVSALFSNVSGSFASSGSIPQRKMLSMSSLSLIST